MKSIIVVLIICTMGVLSACNAQTDKELKSSTVKKETMKIDSNKSMNLVDEQMKLLGGIFSSLETDDEVNPFAGSDNYLEVVDKMEAPEETKQQIRAMYKMYDLSLDPKKKDSLELKVDKMLNDLMNKDQEGLNNNN